MIDQTKFEEHLAYLIGLSEMLATADNQEEAHEYTMRLISAFTERRKVQNG